MDTTYAPPAAARTSPPAHSPPDIPYAPGASVARFLGWVSIGLGLAEILAPRRVARCLGIKDHPDLFTLVGTRQLMSGLGILTQRRPTEWLWTRVAGDAMDLGLLAAAFREAEKDRKAGLIAALAAVAGITALDVILSLEMSTVARMEESSYPPECHTRG